MNNPSVRVCLLVLAALALMPVNAQSTTSYTLLMLQRGGNGNSGPEVEITSPANELYTNRETLSVNVTFAGGTPSGRGNGNANVHLVELYLDNERHSMAANPPNVKEGAFQFDIDLLALEEGLHLLRARAYQGNPNAGLYSEHEIQFTVDRTPPVVTITRPSNGTPSAEDEVLVRGRVDEEAEVTVGTTPADLDGLDFSAESPLREGTNTLIVSAVDRAGNTGATSVVVLRDTTDPRVVITSPRQGQVIPGSTVTVTGTVNDLAIGSVNANDCQVTVNGIVAEVANRGFVAHNVPVVEGPSTIVAVGRDRLGNSASTSIEVVGDSRPLPRITTFSGDGQVGTIGTALIQPLVARVADSEGNPLEGVPVNFSITRGDGILGNGTRNATVLSSSTGTAAVSLFLGTKTGAASDRVEAGAVGFIGRASFCAGALVDPSAVRQLQPAGETNQVGARTGLAPQPLVVLLTDDQANPMPNQNILFEVVEGGGLVNGGEQALLATDSNGRAQVVWTLGPAVGINSQRVVASTPGSRSVTFQATTLERSPDGLTQIAGIVLDNENLPIPGVKLHIEGHDDEVFSDDEGRFVISNAPAGYIHLLVEGNTAGPYPHLAFELTLVQSAANEMNRPIFLPVVDDDGIVQVRRNKEAVLTRSDMPGFRMTIAPGSATFADGSPTGTVQVIPVNRDKVPMAPPDGTLPRQAFSIQPASVHFDPPAQIVFPNVDGTAPGEVVSIYSFDHDVGAFVVIGTAQTSEDGSVIASEFGQGIIKGGWHLVPPKPPPALENTRNRCRRLFCQDVDNCYWCEPGNVNSICHTPDQNQCTRQANSIAANDQPTPDAGCYECPGRGRNCQDPGSTAVAEGSFCVRGYDPTHNGTALEGFCRVNTSGNAAGLPTCCPEGWWNGSNCVDPNSKRAEPLAPQAPIVRGPMLTDGLECTAEALNISGFVDSDGSISLFNLPGGQSPFRVRVTCRDLLGNVYEGVSELLDESEADGLVIDDIDFDGNAPIPSVLDVSPRSSRLEGLGTTLQLSVNANYPDGGLADVSDGDSGTVYSSSNNAVVEVSPDGLVTGVGAGSAVIGVLHEGSLGLVTVVVLPAALETVTLDPPAAQLNLNPLYGVQTLQLSLRGGLADGSSIDLSSAASGTTYTSSDPDVVAVNTTGEVAGIGAGTATITATNNGVVTSAEVTVNVFEPSPFGVIDTPGFAHNLAFKEGLLLVAVGSAGLQILDVQSGETLSATSFGSDALDVKVRGDLAVLGLSNGFATVDVSDPFQPVELARVSDPGSVRDLWISGDLLFLAGSGILHIYNINFPDAPAFMGSQSFSGTVRAVAGDAGRNIALALTRGRLETVRIGGPAPWPVIGVDLPNDAADDLTVLGSKAYVANGLRGVHEIDLTDPNMPVRGNNTSITVSALGVAAHRSPSGTLVGVADNTFINAIALFGPSMVHLANIDFSQYSDANGTGIDFNDSLGAVSVGPYGVQIFRTDELRDRAGIAPVTSLLRPTAGSELTLGRENLLYAYASDDVAVASVEFLLDGEVVATDDWPPFVVRYTPQTPGEAELSVRAIDLGGNVGESQPIPVTIKNLDGVVITLEDFESGASGWSYSTGGNANLVSNFAGARVLGRFPGVAVEKTFDLSQIPHQYVMVKFDFYSIDSWDCGFPTNGNDGFSVYADGEIRFNACFGGFGVHVDGNPNYTDRICREDVYSEWPTPLRPPVILCFPHNDEQLELSFASLLNQSTPDESWAIDNLEIIALDECLPGLDFVDLQLNPNAQDYKQDCIITGTCLP